MIRNALKSASGVLLACALATSTLPAAAQDTNAGKRFAAAQKLYEEGAYTPALAEFKALAAETNSPNADLYVARCLRELGRLVEAYEATTIAVRNATAKAEQEPKYVSTRNAAAADLAQLEPKVAKIIVAVANPPAGMQVTLNGTPLAAERLGVPVVLAPAEVVVRLTAPDHADVERRVVLKAGDTTTLPLAFAAPAPTPPPPSSPAPTALGGVRIGGIVVLGVGAAGMATFAGAGVSANNRYDAISAACGGKHCTDPSYHAQIDGGRQLDLAANVGLGVGIAGLLGGALMVALGKPTTAAPPVTGWAMPAGGGLAVRQAF
jgi:hypothetical protein